MKLLISVFFLIFLGSCATPQTQSEHDEFQGGTVVHLKENQLDTPGFGDIYFNARAKMGENGKLEYTVIGQLDYENQTANFRIDKARELSILVDGKAILLKPIADSQTLDTKVGWVSGLKIVSQWYSVNEDQLERIANGKVVKMRLYSSEVHDGGAFTGTFTQENIQKVQDFLIKAKAIQSTESMKDS